MFEDDEPMLVRLRELALAYPDAAEKVSHGAPAFYTTKVFAYYGGSEKLPGGGHVRHDASLLVPTEPVDRLALAEDPRVFRPMYLGPAGWIGLHLDDRTDWQEVDELLESAYRLTAGVRRIRRLDELRG